MTKSYFGGVRKGQRGRGAAGKVAVFGCLERKGKVYTQMISDVKENTLIPIIRRKIRRADSIIYTDHFRSYNALDVSEFQHLRRFNGIPHSKFHLFLKECEFRFNYGPPKKRLTPLKKWLK